MIARREPRLFVVTALVAVAVFAGRRPVAAVLLEARAIAEPVTVDGILNDPVWSGVPVASGFIQREPAVGSPATEDTEIRVAFTPTALYISICALDSSPESVVARMMEQDADLTEDDSVSIVLDTFLDRRNGYFFATNANGARTDGLITDEGATTNFEWDGVWQVRARRTEVGWTAEMEIPFSTLRFAPGGGSWGMNVRRLVRRRAEESYWAPLPLEADIARFSLAGELSGISGISPGLNLRVKPFAVASGKEIGAASDGVETGNDTGVDLKWGIGRGLALDLTVNTDFAEAEVDEQQVNLSRFSIFLPEKREFFLENAGIFEFGPRASYWPTLFRPFFSRRIGIGEDGQPVPIEWGARLTGRSGPWTLGLMEARTGGEDGEDWGVLRLRRQVGAKTSVGLLSTRRAGEEGTNSVYGVDADFDPTSRLKVRTFFAMSDDSEEGSGRTGGVSAAYRGPVWRFSLDALEIGERFDPEMGYLRRSGVRRYASTLTFVPRPAIPVIRNFYFEGRGELFTDLEGEVESSHLIFDLFSFRTKADDALGIYSDSNFERIPAPFAIHPGVIIPAGEYEWNDLGLWVETNGSRAVSGSAWVQQGTFYDGLRLAHGVKLKVQPGRRFRAETSWDRHRVDLPAGSFTTNLFRERLHYSFTPDLVAAAFVQWSDSADLLAANFRLGWSYRPGADVFLVLNQTWDAPDLSSRERRDRQAILKVTYLFAV